MTKQYAVIGWPLGYSLSPLLHNTFIKQEGFDATYTSTPLTLEELGSWVKTAGFSGFNVTVPHKENIMPFLDELSDSATSIGAVNTVRNDNGRLIGTNTDAPGFTLMLKEELRLKMKGLHIILLGAGGAAKAISYAALSEGASTLWVYDTAIEKTNQLQTQYPQWSKQIIPVTDKALLRDKLGIADLVINATPVGMESTLGQSVLSFDELQLMKPSAIVVDIIYAPAKTKLLEMAEELRLTHLNGLGMLVGQGILAEEFWFGKRLDYKVAKGILQAKI